MEHFAPRFTRRDFFTALSAGVFATPVLQLFSEEALRWVEDGGFAQELVRTPALTEGPFYPVSFPPDMDNDLVRVQGRAAEAMGQVTHVAGRVLNRRGEPVRAEV